MICEEIPLFSFLNQKSISTDCWVTYKHRRILWDYALAEAVSDNQNQNDRIDSTNKMR